ncbi:MAG: ATP-binding domain-containing protein [Chthoniobacter sp.]|nr:ATP-binding domain-containing protein [Chthoniobacter sp.]
MAQWFIPPLTERHGSKAELQVLNALRSALSDRMHCDVYAQFPVREGYVRVPDFLILDRELGLILLEVKGLLAAQVGAVAGDCWQVKDYFGKQEINPFRQGMDALDMLCAHGPQPAPPRRVGVVLPYIEGRDWWRAGHRAEKAVLFREELRGDLLNRLREIAAVGGGGWHAEAFHEWRQHLGGTMREEPFVQPKKGEIARTLENYVAGRDGQLRGDAIDVPNGAYRVRGIAGSGKTTLLAQSAAWMLFNEPASRIAFVYHSRSLFDHSYSLVVESLRKFAAGRGQEVICDEKDGKVGLSGAVGGIRVFNAWGGKASCGFYTFLCSHLGCAVKTMDEAKADFWRRFRREPGSGDLLPFLCLDLLERYETNIEPYFDGVFIDEAQDLISNDEAVRYRDREPFFWLAYRSLKPVRADNPAQRRLIFAYDEAQSLSTLHIPSASRLFGEELTTLFQGGRGRNRIMRCSFRNPKPILIAAHVLGMGFLRERGAVQGLTAEEWRAIGYEVEGSFRQGDVATLRRSDEHSPNPVPKLWRAESITVMQHASRDAELEWLRNALCDDVQNHGLKASRDILVIDLRNESLQVKAALEKPRKQGGEKLRCFIPGADWSDPNTFWREGCITLTNVRRAKGNEAPMVYVVGLDALSESGGTRREVVCARNTFFVALTRAQAWVSLSGVEKGPAVAAIFEEIRKVVGMVQSSSSSVEFVYRTDRDFRNLAHEDQPELELV